MLKMRKDERKKTENRKEKKRKEKEISRQDRDNEGTMKRYEKRWKAESRVGDNMRNGKERDKRESQESAFELI